MLIQYEHFNFICIALFILLSDLKCDQNLPNITNGSVIYSSPVSTVGSFVQYECDSYFIIHPNSINMRHCLEGNQWSSEDIKCIGSWLYTLFAIADAHSIGTLNYGP